jgi:hypothetical protein
MLRAWIALLLLANAVFFMWTQGWLDGLTGFHARGDREPERLLRQVHPEAVKVLSPQAVAAAASAADARLACLEAGPFGPAEAVAAEAALTSVLPTGRWTRVKVDVPPVWIVYMGKYANREAQQKKEDELARIRVGFEVVKNAPEFEPGLSLGRFDDRAGAESALAQFSQRGIRSARVVELSKPATAQLLRVTRADTELATKLAALKADTRPLSFAACARP